ncbi:MAG: DoxX family protein [Proteobacteria bacterium]|nr:DoxX family protein [Pseudomonadota bacterium]MBS0462207.1 DoxX family protein [Pseudomonadota bacterium]
MSRLQRLTHFYDRGAELLAAWLGPTALLLMRLWVAIAFWQAGVVKFDDPIGTHYLFHEEYHVPLLPPDTAAFLGTWIELIVPWLLGFGLAGRLTALLLFAHNAIAVISYPDLWPHGFWTGLFNTSDFADHKSWALMLLAVIAWGPGRWSLDAVLRPYWMAKATR